MDRLPRTLARRAAASRTSAALLVLASMLWAPVTQAAGADADPPFDTLSMSRSGCYGTCPIYSVVVHGDGRVGYDGVNFVGHVGPAETRLSALQMQALRIEVDRADLPRLRDTYASKSDGCPALWTDAPGVELSLRRRGVVKTIHHSLGCMDPKGTEVYPAALATLELRIDEIVRTRQWVEPAKAPKSEAK